jgi:methionyl-tRNA formyltransferase
MARFLARKTGLPNAAYYNARIWSRLLLASLSGRERNVDYGAFCGDILFTSNMNGLEMECFLAERRLDLLVLGQSGIVRENILRLPRIGTLNSHPGQLPDFRGVDVVRWALLARRPIVATLHFVDRGVDTGDTIRSVRVPVGPEDEIEDLEHRAVEHTLDLLTEAVAQIAAGQPMPRSPQPPGMGRQYYLMPPWTQRRLRRQWPEIRSQLARSANAQE